MLAEFFMAVVTVMRERRIEWTTIPLPTFMLVIRTLRQQRQHWQVAVGMGPGPGAGVGGPGPGAGTIGRWQSGIANGTGAHSLTSSVCGDIWWTRGGCKIV